MSSLSGESQTQYPPATAGGTDITLCPSSRIQSQTSIVLTSNLLVGAEATPRPQSQPSPREACAPPASLRASQHRAPSQSLHPSIRLQSLRAPSNFLVV